MNKVEFDKELRIACAKYEETSSLYWCGFVRGLQRAFRGNAFSTSVDHFAWLDFRHDPDACIAELGRGYRDGLDRVVSFGVSRRQVEGQTPRSRSAIPSVRGQQ
jgi:hypothetical protein